MLKKYIKNPLFLLLLLVVFSAIASLLYWAYYAVFANVPTELNYQGKLTDANGVNVADGTYNFQVRIYNDPTLDTAGALLYTQTINTVQVTNGIFNLKFSPSASVLVGGDRYVQICFDSNATDSDAVVGCGTTATSTGDTAFDRRFLPRKLIRANPYSVLSQYLGTNYISGGTGGDSGALIFTGNTSVGVSATDSGRIYYDSTRDTLRCSQNGEPYEDCANTLGKVWTLRTTPNSNNLYSVAYGNGTFVAVGNTGTGNRVSTSVDGVNWVSRTTPIDNDWYYVTYGNGLFVAVATVGLGTNDRVMTSPDGINWTVRASAADVNWRAVTYGNGTFVAVSDTGTNRVMTSPDGINWTARSAPAQSWFNVTYGNGLFVAVAQSGTGNRVMTSSDGIAWTNRSTPADLTWIGVTYGNGLFVAVAQSGTGNRVMTSPDGLVWTSRTTPADNNWSNVAYGNGMFVAVAQSGTGNRVMTSIDGITWTLRNSAADNNWKGITYGNGMFVATALSGGTSRVMTSGFTSSTVAPPNNLYQGGLSLNGTLRLNTVPYNWPSSQGGSNTFLRNDGSGNLTWTSSTFGVGTIDSITKVANGGSVSSNNLIFQTADANYPGLVSNGTQIFTGQKTFGLNQLTQKGFSSTWYSVSMSSSGQYQTAAGWNNSLYRSTDYGATWNTIGSSGQWFGIAISSDGSRQTATLQNGQIYTSTDYGVTWTPRDSNRAWQRVSMSSNGQYQTAVVDAGQIYRSIDYGVTWSPVDSSRSWRGIAVSSSGQYQLANTNSTYIYVSSDYGATWTQKGDSSAWNDVDMTSDGRIQVAVRNFSPTALAISTDYGVNWSYLTPGGSGVPMGVAISDDGSVITIAHYSGYVLLSKDGGVTFTTLPGTPQLYQDVDMSSDGTYQTSVVYSGFLYTYSASSVFFQGNVGVGNTSPASLFSIGGNSQFRVNSVGDLIRIRDISYSWPSSQGGSNTFLRNDGSGNLTWQTVSASPAGSNGQVQFNNSGAFGASGSLVWDNTANRLGIGASPGANKLHVDAGTQTGATPNVASFFTSTQDSNLSGSHSITGNTYVGWAQTNGYDSAYYGVNSTVTRSAASNNYADTGVAIFGRSTNTGAMVIGDGVFSDHQEVVAGIHGRVDGTWNEYVSRSGSYVISAILGIDGATGTANRYAGYFSGDVTLEPNFRLILDSDQIGSGGIASNIKGDSYITYTSANSSMDFYNDNVRIVTLRTGYLGVGDTAPAQLFTVNSANTVNTGISRITNTSTSVIGTTATNTNVAGLFVDTSDTDTISLLVRNTGTPTMANVGTAGSQGDPGVLTVEGNGVSSAYNLITAYNSNTRSDTAAVFRVRADGAVYGEAAFNSSGADFAEWFKISDQSDYGSIIGYEKGELSVAKNIYSPILGVISDTPGFVGNSKKSEDPDYKLVGLLGQVMTFVDNSKGEIRKGDYISVSDKNPGVGAKLIGNGWIVGIALEDYLPIDNEEFGKILVLVRPTYISTSSKPSDYTYVDNAGVLVFQKDIRVRSLMAESATIKKASINELSVTRLNQKDTKNNQTWIGTGKIRANQRFVDIDNRNVRNEYKIFVTATTKTSQTLSVTKIIDGKGFRVEVPENTSSDVSFNYWIIGME